MRVWMQQVLTILEWVAFVSLLIAIVVRYWPLRHRLYYFATHYVPPTVFVLLFYALLVGGYGTQYGIPNLFWHDHPVTRLFAAVWVTLLFAVVWICAFFADPEKARTQTELRRFLGEQGPPPADETLHDQIKRFLLVSWSPFLLLLWSPAIFPDVFTGVPKFIDAGLGLSGDAGNHPLAWLIGVLLWGAGIAIGVGITWGVIAATRRISEGSAERPRGGDVIAPAPPAQPQVEVAPEPREEGLEAGDARVPRADSNPAERPLVPRDAGKPTDIERYDQEMRKREEIQDNAAIQAGLCRFLVIVVGVYVAFGLLNIFWPGLRLRSAAFPICLLLSALTVGYFVTAVFLFRYKYVFVAVLILAIGLLNVRPFKLRFPHMEIAGSGNDSYYDNPSLEKSGVDPGVRPIKAPAVDCGDPASGDEAVSDDHEVLCKWRRRFPSGQGHPKPVLAVVACSGGANRAGLWTAVVLETLDRRLTGFADRLRLVTGASGGMVGASYYVAALHKEHLKAEGDPGAGSTNHNKQGWLVNRMELDSLTPVAQQMVLGDIPAIFCPWVLSRDRGTVLESTWPELDIPLRSLRKQEEAGEIPSLIFSPMIVEDGRRLLISNLELGFMTRTSGRLLGSGSDEQLYSHPSVSFFKLFPEADEFRLATAVRMSATFPFVSPAVNLPTEPPLRVVDAGYLDNYGINTAVAWIYHHRQTLATQTSGVVLIQVRAYPGGRDRLEFPEPFIPFGEKLGRGFQFLSSPLEGGLAARNASTLFRNDMEIKAIGDWFRDNAEMKNAATPFFTTVIFETDLDIAMNWYTTEAELNELTQEFDVSNSKNVKRLEALESWWPSRQSTK